MNPPPAEGLRARLFIGPALRTQPDRRLVTLVRDGYESAFEEIVRRYGKALGHYAAAIVGARSEEVTQDAFSKALLALRRSEGQREIQLRPWLYAIVRNRALNDLRDRPPDSIELREALAGEPSAAEEAERREEVSELLERLQALPDPQRAAIVMRELEGLGHEEIAAALGLTGGAARQAIYRARQALRDGVGMLIPLPLLRSLIDHGVEAGAAAGTGGALAAGGAAGGMGAGTALKVGAISAAVLAGGLGTGLALKNHHSHGRDDAAATTRSIDSPVDRSPASAPSPKRGASSSAAPGPGSDRGPSPDAGSGRVEEGGRAAGGRGSGDGLGEARDLEESGAPAQGGGGGGRPGGGPGPSLGSSGTGHQGAGSGPGEGAQTPPEGSGQDAGGGRGPGSGDSPGGGGAPGGSGSQTGGDSSGGDDGSGGSGTSAGGDGGGSGGGDHGSGQLSPPPPAQEGTSGSGRQSGSGGSDSGSSGPGGSNSSAEGRSSPATP